MTQCELMHYHHLSVTRLKLRFDLSPLNIGSFWPNHFPVWDKWQKKYQVRVCIVYYWFQFGGIDSFIHCIYCNIENFNGRNFSCLFEERKAISYDNFPLDNFSSCQLLHCRTNSINRAFSMCRCKKKKKAMLFQYCICFITRIKLELCTGL